MDIEDKSMVVYRAIINKSSTDWKIAKLIDIAWYSLDKMEFTIKHVYREANATIDLLAKMGRMTKDKFRF